MCPSGVLMEVLHQVGVLKNVLGHHLAHRSQN